MKAKKQGLQRLTETDKKIAILLSKKKITQTEVDALFNDRELIEFGEALTKKLNEAKDIRRDKLLEQLDEILPTDFKNQVWESNHYAITISISKHIEEYGKMPTKNTIAYDSGLSRQTVHKHLKEFTEHPFYAAQLRQFKFMADRVLAKVIKQAALGDMKAARLYFEVIGNLNGQLMNNNTLIKTQNNNIQINGTVISQEIIKYLNPEQLNTIESILKTVLENPVQTDQPKLTTN